MNYILSKDMIYKKSLKYAFLICLDTYGILTAISTVWNDTQFNDVADNTLIRRPAN